MILANIKADASINNLDQQDFMVTLTVKLLDANHGRGVLRYCFCCVDFFFIFCWRDSCGQTTTKLEVRKKNFEKRHMRRISYITHPFEKTNQNLPPPKNRHQKAKSSSKEAGDRIGSPVVHGYAQIPKH